MKKYILQLLFLLLMPLTAQTINPDAFIFKVKINGSGDKLNLIADTVSNDSDPVQIYDYNVDWGDGNTSIGIDTSFSKMYTTPGEYTVEITGVYPELKIIGDTTLVAKVTSVEQWGTNVWQSTTQMFFNQDEFTTINATDLPRFAEGITMIGMFENCRNFNVNINDWDLNGAVDLTEMFKGAISFNQPLNNWDVSKVKNTNAMFSRASSFNKSLNDWDVSSVEQLGAMFNNATSFNQPLDKWDTSSVTSMFALFDGAASFNQSIDNWNVSNVTNMIFLFGRAKAFNQPLNSWDVSNVIKFNGMFNDASSFNQSLDNWSVTSCDNFSSMFRNALSFNQPLTNFYPRVEATSYNFFLLGSNMSNENYNTTIVAWSKAKDIARNANFFRNNAKMHCSDGGVALAFLINDLGWKNVSDGGLDTSCSLSLGNSDIITNSAKLNEVFYSNDDKMIHISTNVDAKMSVVDLTTKQVKYMKVKKGESTEESENLAKGSFFILSLIDKNGKLIAEPTKMVK